MKVFVTDLLRFLRKPQYTALPDHLSTSEKWLFFGRMFSVALLTTLILSPIFSLVESLDWISLENHAVEQVLESQPKLTVFLLIVLLAPIIEELLFRAPLKFTKESRIFPFWFYLFSAVFGFVHITNYPLSVEVLLLSPLLVAPQLILGCYLGYIRIKLGLLWAILLHALYNAFFMFVTFAGQ
ncbi:CAAX protease [Tenacibaculum litopenaei]|uniref:CPBP family intramembrane glutamic endopeptidase n=1 Tax=Tenacibaculum litopenaei TaxID=396016 RepID=UPI0038961A97